MSWTTAGRLRYERLVATHGRSVAIALAVVGLVLASVALAGVVWPPTETTTETGNVTVVSVEQTDAATVTGDSELYDRGTVIRDSPVYLTQTAPKVTVTVETNVSDGSLQAADRRLALVYRAERDGTVYWRNSTILAGESGSVSSGSTTTSATVDVEAVQRRIQTLSRETGARTVVDAVLTHRVAYETATDEGELRSTAALSVSERTYSLSDGLEASETHVQRRQVTRPDSVETRTLFGGRLTVANWTSWFGPTALVFLVGAGHAAVVARRRHDVAALERRLERDRFSEWVSRGRIPDAVDERRVPVDSLADLVDVAIDADRRVVYDTERSLYVLFDDDVAYTYAPPSVDVVDPFEDRKSESERSTSAGPTVRSDGDGSSGTDSANRSVLADAAGGWIHSSDFLSAANEGETSDRTDRSGGEGRTDGPTQSVEADETDATGRSAEANQSTESPRSMETDADDH